MLRVWGLNRSLRAARGARGWLVGWGGVAVRDGASVAHAESLEAREVGASVHAEEAVVAEGVAARGGAAAGRSVSVHGAVAFSEAEAQCVWDLLPLVSPSRARSLRAHALAVQELPRGEALLVSPQSLASRQKVRVWLLPVSDALGNLFPRLMGSMEPPTQEFVANVLTVLSLAGTMSSESDLVPRVVHSSGLTSPAWFAGLGDGSGGGSALGGSTLPQQLSRLLQAAASAPRRLLQSGERAAEVLAPAEGWSARVDPHLVPGNMTSWQHRFLHSVELSTAAATRVQLDEVRVREALSPGAARAAAVLRCATAPPRGTGRPLARVLWTYVCEMGLVAEQAAQGRMDAEEVARRARTASAALHVRLWNLATTKHGSSDPDTWLPVVASAVGDLSLLERATHMSRDADVDATRWTRLPALLGLVRREDGAIRAGPDGALPTDVWGGSGELWTPRVRALARAHARPTGEAERMQARLRQGLVRVARLHACGADALLRSAQSARSADVGGRDDLLLRLDRAMPPPALAPAAWDHRRALLHLWHATVGLDLAAQRRGLPYVNPSTVLTAAELRAPASLAPPRLDPAELLARARAAGVVPSDAAHWQPVAADALERLGGPPIARPAAMAAFREGVRRLLAPLEWIGSYQRLELWADSLRAADLELLLAPPPQPGSHAPLPWPAQLREDIVASCEALVQAPAAAAAPAATHAATHAAARKGAPPREWEAVLLEHGQPRASSASSRRLESAPRAAPMPASPPRFWLSTPSLAPAPSLQALLAPAPAATPAALPLGAAAVTDARALLAAIAPCAALLPGGDAATLTHPRAALQASLVLLASLVSGRQMARLRSAAAAFADDAQRGLGTRARDNFLREARSVLGTLAVLVEPPLAAALGVAEFGGNAFRDLLNSHLRTNILAAFDDDPAADSASESTDAVEAIEAVQATEPTDAAVQAAPPATPPLAPALAETRHATVPAGRTVRVPAPPAMQMRPQDVLLAWIVRVALDARGRAQVERDMDAQNSQRRWMRALGSDMGSVGGSSASAGGGADHYDYSYGNNNDDDEGGRGARRRFTPSRGSTGSDSAAESGEKEISFASTLALEAGEDESRLKVDASVQLVGQLAFPMRAAELGNSWAQASLAVTSVEQTAAAPTGPELQSEASSESDEGDEADEPAFSLTSVVPLVPKLTIDEAPPSSPPPASAADASPSSSSSRSWAGVELSGPWGNKGAESSAGGSVSLSSSSSSSSSSSMGTGSPRSMLAFVREQQLSQQSQAAKGEELDAQQWARTMRLPLRMRADRWEWAASDLEEAVRGLGDRVWGSENPFLQSSSSQSESGPGGQADLHQEFWGGSAQDESRAARSALRDPFVLVEASLLTRIRQTVGNPAKRIPSVHPTTPSPLGGPRSYYASRRASAEQAAAAAAAAGTWHVAAQEAPAASDAGPWTDVVPADALPWSEEAEARTVFVQGIPPGVSAAELAQALSACGAVESVRVLDERTRLFRGALRDKLRALRLDEERRAGLGKTQVYDGAAALLAVVESRLGGWDGDHGGAMDFEAGGATTSAAAAPASAAASASSAAAAVLAAQRAQRRAANFSLQAVEARFGGADPEAAHVANRLLQRLPRAKSQAARRSTLKQVEELIARNPTHGLVTFASRDGALRATTDPMRIFGVSVRGAACKIHAASDGRFLYLGQMPSGRAPLWIASQLSMHLGPAAGMWVRSKDRRELGSDVVSSGDVLIEFRSLREALLGERALLVAARNAVRARVFSREKSDNEVADVAGHQWWHELVGNPAFVPPRQRLPSLATSAGVQTSLPPFVVGWASPDEFKAAQPRLPRYF
jgi:hypothetical protein